MRLEVHNILRRALSLIPTPEVSCGGTRWQTMPWWRNFLCKLQVFLHKCPNFQLAPLQRQGVAFPSLHSLFETAKSDTSSSLQQASFSPTAPKHHSRTKHHKRGRTPPQAAHLPAGQQVQRAVSVMGSSSSKPSPEQAEQLRDAAQVQQAIEHAAAARPSQTIASWPLLDLVASALNGILGLC